MLKFHLKHFLDLGKITPKVVVNLETIIMKTTYQNLWTRAKTVQRKLHILIYTDKEDRKEKLII